MLSFNGRYSRKKFWSGALGIVGLMILMLLPLAAMNNPTGGSGGPVVLSFLSLILVALYSKLIAHRLQDLGLSPWWTLLLAPLLIVVPVLMLKESNDIYLRIEQSYKAQQAIKGYVAFMFFGSFALFFGGLIGLGSIRGTKGPNKYGSDPLDQPYPIS